MSLRGPVLTLTARQEVSSLMGWMDGTDYQKCHLTLFILSEYIHKVYVRFQFFVYNFWPKCDPPKVNPFSKN